MKQTYEVHITANAVRDMKIRAASAREAMEIAESRIRDMSGPWSIQLPGSGDEHFSVHRVSDGEFVGPDSADGFTDEDEEDDEA